MPTTTDLGRVRERSTATYTVTLKDEAGVVIPRASITEVTLTLYDVQSRAVLNSRDSQNVLDANNVTIHSTSGLLTWLIQAADNAVVTTKENALERHRAVFRYKWAGGTKEDWHAIEWLVEAEPEVD